MKHSVSMVAPHRVRRRRNGDADLILGALGLGMGFVALGIMIGVVVALA